MSDQVETPKHYTEGGIETIDFIKAKLGAGFIFYCLGNCFKYLSRAGKKDDMLTDLKKCRQYLNWTISEIENT